MGKHKKKDKKSKHKHDKRERERKHSTRESSSEDEWVEKKSTNKESSLSDVSREDWMSLPTNFLTVSNDERKMKREEAKRLEKLGAQYNPRECARELNPYWKNGGDGLPSTSKFMKPTENNQEKTYKSRVNQQTHVPSWRKSSGTKESVKNEEEMNKSNAVLTDKELNALAAKLVKAEIMGNDKLVAELKDKLEVARRAKNSISEQQNSDESVILTRTDSKGFSRPLRNQTDDLETKQKKRKVETHVSGERVRYFPDDDKYSLKQMFENEKFNSVEDQNSEFLKLSGKVSKNDDLDDIFTDKIRAGDSAAKKERRDKARAINEHQQSLQSLENCKYCIQSDKMQKHLMVSMGSTFYVTLPSYEPITDGHCLLVPIRHASCATQLEENEWHELLTFRRSLTQMFSAQDKDIIFFESVKSLNRFPHMHIECVPVPKEQGDEAPIYFKKAIDESEMEWSSNKKLISLKGRDVQKAVPKGLPYFSVSFGMQEGYAHVIEDERLFPNNFAQEIIGGMLDLHHSKWKRPKVQHFEEQSKRVLSFNSKWKDFDPITT